MENIKEFLVSKPFLLEMFYQKKAPLEMYLDYREGVNDGVDIDASSFNMYVYKIILSRSIENTEELQLENYEGSKYQLRAENFCYRGDTAVNAMSVIMQIINADTAALCCRKDISAVRELLNRTEFMKNKKYADLLNTHIRLCYGIGNFYPISYTSEMKNNIPSLNLAKAKLRSAGYNGCQFFDSMDKFISVMYQYFAYGKKDFCQLVKAIDEYYTDWADKFGEGEQGWESFVSCYCFEPFTDEGCKPKTFWKRAVGNEKPEDKIADYLENINYALAAREQLLADRINNAILTQ